MALPFGILVALYIDLDVWIFRSAASPPPSPRAPLNWVLEQYTNFNRHRNLYKGLEMRHEIFDPQPLKYLWAPVSPVHQDMAPLHCSPYPLIRKSIWSDLKHLVAKP